MTAGSRFEQIKLEPVAAAKHPPSQWFPPLRTGRIFCRASSVPAFDG
jgi:hypothetical protein